MVHLSPVEVTPRGLVAGLPVRELAEHRFVYVERLPERSVACGGLDRRRVLPALAIMIGTSNLLTAAPNFAIMASARILLGIGVGGFWAMGGGHERE